MPFSARGTGLVFFPDWGYIASFMTKRLSQLVLAGLLLLTAVIPARAQETLPQDKNAAVILVYNRVGEDLHPATNIAAEQFEYHIEELVNGGYNVMALPAIIEALKNETTLPDRTVAITFDTGHKSVLQNAVPVLAEHGLPYTVFIAADYADQGSEQYMDWNDLRRLSRDKLATIGIHTAAFTRLSGEPEAEIARQVNNARVKFREQLKQEATLFAYPFGEYDAAYRKYIAGQGFAAAFGQQSGAAWNGADMFALPRFPVTDTYGSAERFRMIASSLPLPVTEVSPDTSKLREEKPHVGFTIDERLEPQLGTLSCFVSGQDKPEMQVLGARRIELRPTKALEQERTRINCTLPGPRDDEDAPRWRWFGMLLTAGVVADARPDEIAAD